MRPQNSYHGMLHSIDKLPFDICNSLPAISETLDPLSPFKEDFQRDEHIVSFIQHEKARVLTPRSKQAIGLLHF